MNVSFIHGRLVFICLSAFLLIFILNSRAFGQQPPEPKGETAADPIQKGIAYLVSGKLDEAEREFLSALAVNPKLHRARYGLGLVSQARNKPAIAISHFKEAVSIQPDYAPAWRALGSSYELLDDPAAAVVNYQKAVSLEGVNPAFAADVAIARFRLSQIGQSSDEAIRIKGLRNQAMDLLKEKKKDLSLKTWQTILEIVPDHLEALENAGVLTLDLGRFEESAGFLQRVIKIDRTILLAHYLLGNVYELLDRPGEAWEQYNAVIQEGEKIPGAKDVPRARAKLARLGATREIAIEASRRLKNGHALLKEKKIDEAGIEFGEVIRQVPGSTQGHLAMAAIDLLKGRYSDGRKEVSEVLEGDPGNLSAHLFSGKIYLSEASFDKAFDEFLKVLDLGKDPVNARVYPDEIEEAQKETSRLGSDPSRAREVAKWLLEAGELEKKEDFQGAAALLNKIIAVAPENLYALEKLGDISLRETTFNLDLAELSFMKILKINPGLSNARMKLAGVFRAKGETEKALSEYREVIARDKTGAGPSVRARKLQEQMGGTPEAAREIDRLLRGGEAYLKEGRLEEAEKWFFDVLKVVPDQNQALLALGSVYLQKKNFAEAEKTFRALLESDPSHVEARVQHGLVLGALGKFEEGAAELEKVIASGAEGKALKQAKEEIGPMRERARGSGRYLEGLNILKKIDELEKAPEAPGKREEISRLLSQSEEAFRTAFQQDPRNPYYNYSLGYYFLLKGDLVEGEKMLRRTIALNPDMIIARFRLATLYELAGAWEPAKENYEKIMKLGKPEDDEVKIAREKIPRLAEKIGHTKEAEGYNILGLVFMASGAMDKAEGFFKKSLELAPENEDFWNNLGNLYNARGDDDRALDAYQRAVKIRSNFALPYFSIGVILEKQDRTSEAIEYFRKAEQNLVDRDSREGKLILERAQYYGNRTSGSVTASVFNYDSNINLGAISPISAVYSVYGVSLKYFHYKSAKTMLLSSGSLLNAIYYSSQILQSGANYALELRRVGINGIDLLVNESLGSFFTYGGMAGWSATTSLDIQRKGEWFDFTGTHLGYSYSPSIINPFYSSVREDLTWSFSKKISPGIGSLSIGATNLDTAGVTDSNISVRLAGSYAWSPPPFSSASLSAGLTVSDFKIPDPIALQSGSAQLRQNRGYNLSGSVSYPLYKDITLSGSAGYQRVVSNLPTAEDRNLTDILSQQTSAIGSYEKFTLGFSIAYSF